MNKKPAFSVQTVTVKMLIWFALLLFLIFALFPYYWMFVTALKPRGEIFQSPPTLFPSTFVWTNLTIPWRQFPVAQYFANSLFITAWTVVLDVLVGALAAYGMIRRRLRGAKLIIFFLLFTQLLPGAVTIAPFYFWMKNLGMLNTYTGLILSYVAWTLPFTILLLRAYFLEAFPQELEDAARIDGSGRLRTFISVLLPISVPGLVAAAAFSFILAWKEFLWASIMITTGARKPISVGLRDLIGEGGGVQYMSEFMAIAIATTIPAFLFFFIVQRYIASGLTAGAVKG
ncbi:MAG: sugar ABC transporter permease [Chloroflexota bacterium]|nr:carbohydrate ABC transporter permease [Caldilinea sp.]GIK71757.1 MAG: sugar ABC transporter permease [Chloroflexota bacterium]